jgi:hypothetical protein
MPNFYSGVCEECEQYSDERDCYYNDLGEEKYICPECATKLNKENSDDSSS